MKYFILLWTNVPFCRILRGESNQLLTKSNSKPNVFLFFVSKNLNRHANKKKRNEMPTGRTKKNSITVKLRSMKYFILLWTNVPFCQILRGKTIKLLTKSNSNPTVFLFWLLRKTWTDVQTKKKKRNAHWKKKKELHNGEIKVNEKFYSSLNKCSFLSDSLWGKNQLLNKSNLKPNVFLFLLRKT